MKKLTLFITLSIISLLFLHFSGDTSSFADDWYEAEEASSFDYTAVAGIKSASAEKNEKTSSLTPVFSKNELADVTASTNNMQAVKTEFQTAMTFSSLSSDSRINTNDSYTSPDTIQGVNTGSDTFSAIPISYQFDENVVAAVGGMPPPDDDTDTGDQGDDPGPTPPPVASFI
ncbi:MAG: hypothetical protein PHH49_05665 [Candidatus Omnitrophica bacterium]|nr:hypothetical protein [Candidatus Omnitrophota bacterium]MDD5488430.1 hypothetical protein [Candidatus Omnitrophota bacterium]